MHQLTEAYTGGPWQSQHDFSLEGELTIIGNVDGEIIDGHTHHHYKLVCEAYEHHTIEETRANVRLIVSAPEMLAALKALNQHARPANWNEEGQRGEPDFEHAQAWRLLDAALAKAAGR